MQLSLSVFVRAASVAATLFLATAAPVSHAVPVPYPRSSGVDSHGQTLASQVMHLVTGRDDLHAQSVDLLQARGKFKPISEFLGEVQRPDVYEAVEGLGLPQLSSGPLTASTTSGSERGRIVREVEQMQPESVATSVASSSGAKKKARKPRDKASVQAAQRRSYIRRVGEGGIPRRFSRKEWEDAQVRRTSRLPDFFDDASVRRRQRWRQLKDERAEQHTVASTLNRDRTVPSSTLSSGRPQSVSSSSSEQSSHSSEPPISPPRRPARKLFFGAWETRLDVASSLRAKPALPRKRKAERLLAEEVIEQERLRHLQRKRESRLRKDFKRTGPEGIEQDLFSEQQWLDALKQGRSERQIISNDAKRLRQREYTRRYRRKVKAEATGAASVEDQNARVPSSVPESNFSSTLRADSAVGAEPNRQTLVPVQVERISPLKIKMKLRTHQPQS